MKSVWTSLRVRLVDSPRVKGAVAWLIWFLMRLTTTTNRFAPGSHDIDGIIGADPNSIFAIWHGQHILAPALMPRWLDTLALVSRSRDAELNALVAERFGIETVRGSGGRPDQRLHGKGGAKALIKLRKALESGRAVCMIADVPGGTARTAGMGIITLAKISGRPIIPIAIATSRRIVLEKTKDKTTINLPFGKLCVIFGSPVTITEDADEQSMEKTRQALTDEMNAITDEAYLKVENSR